MTGGNERSERGAECPYNEATSVKIGSVSIFDTTLRDGEQAPGIALSAEDKVALAKAIDELGVDVMEVGFAYSGESERNAISAIAGSGLRAKICSLSRCKEKDVDAVVSTGAKYIHMFIATSDIHLKYKLKMTREEVVGRVRDTVAYAVSKGLTVHFSCEDATRTELSFLKEVYRTAIEAGASSIDVPDTVGVATPKAMAYLVGELKKEFGVPIAVHCHNDLGLAVANTLASVEAGASVVHVCVNGIGERAGNASLEEVASCLYVNYGVKCVDLSKIVSVSKKVSRYTGYPIPVCKPIVGRNAFAHESGIHVHGIMGNTATYEPFPPELVGADRTIAIGKHSGEHSVMSRLEQMNIDFPEDFAEQLLENVKKIAVTGKDITDIELAAIAENVIWKGRAPDNVKLKEFVAFTGKNATSTATVTIEAGGMVKTCAETGNGPVDAAFNAIRGVFDGIYEIEDYRLEAITGGSDSLCEATVMIRNVRDSGRISVGKSVGSDIVGTSVGAIMEAINRDYSGWQDA